MRRTIGLLAIALGIAAAPVRAQAPDSRLTIADVEKLSGLKGVTQVAKAPARGAGGNLNFAGPEGKLLLMVNFGSASLYDGAKKTPITLHALVPGLGDEAFDGPAAGDVQYTLYVKKGAKAFSLATFFVPRSRPLQPRLSMDQLKAAARVILSRL
jgi:hypothetical protein